MKGAVCVSLLFFSFLPLRFVPILLFKVPRLSNTLSLSLRLPLLSFSFSFLFLFFVLRAGRRASSPPNEIKLDRIPIIRI